MLPRCTHCGGSVLPMPQVDDLAAVACLACARAPTAEPPWVAALDTATRAALETLRAPVVA